MGSCKITRVMGKFLVTEEAYSCRMRMTLYIDANALLWDVAKGTFYDTVYTVRLTGKRHL